MKLHRGPAKYTLEGGQVIVNVHPQDDCAGRPCCVHNPSDHHMREWPQNWRGDRMLMERICPHGVGHPDPDDINPDGVHGCDGCCHVPVSLVRGESRFLCCICFNSVQYEDAYIDGQGVRWDMCPLCGALEAVAQRTGGTHERMVFSPTWMPFQGDV